MRQPPVETITSKDGKIYGRIYYDEDVENPRTWCDHAGVMIYQHRNYILGDERFDPSDMVDEDDNEYEDVEEYLTKERGAICVMPLYIYDHSGVTMSTSSGSCRWDTSHVGYIYMTKKAAVEGWGENYTMEQIQQCLEWEVEEFDDYLTGNVYGFEIYEKKTIQEKCPHCGENTKDAYEEDEFIESCWGIYGLKYVREEVEMYVNPKVKEDDKNV
jgi:hypothetical protein